MTPVLLFVYDSCMATKTISIELDVYEKLKSLKKGGRESFSQVLRRAKWEESISTGASILQWLDTRIKEKKVLSSNIIKLLDDAQASDKAPDSKWD